MSKINLSTIIELFDNLNNYVFMFDNELNIAWKNKFATQDIQLFSKNIDLPSAFLQKSKNEIITYCNNFSAGDYIFDFIHESNIFKIQVKHAFDKSEHKYFLAIVNLVSPVKKENTTLFSDAVDLPPFINREYLSNIFISLEAIEFKLTDVERYDLLPYMNNAITNCQKIYRDTINLFEYVKIISGEISFKREVTALSLMLDDIIAKIKHVNNKIDITMQVSEDAKGLAANIDVEKMYIVFMNIISNSIKFNPDNVRIKISITAFEDKIAISLSDDGFGIPNELCEKVFEPFFSLKPDTFHKNSMGLGLTVAKQIVELHSGSIRLFSGENNGVKIAIHLNIAQPKNNKVSSPINFRQNNRLSISNVFLSDMFSDE